MNSEIMRNTLYKAYLDDFAEFCQSVGGTTGEVMGDLLAFEVGRVNNSMARDKCSYLSSLELGSLLPCDI